MNIQTTMQGLYVTKARFDYLAQQLDKQGCKMAAAELLREADKFGCQLTQIESVLADYQIDIATVQHQEQPRWVGVDRAAGSLANRFNEVDQ
ncbi:hypothetical protein [Vreelandella sp. H-I2]